MKQSITLFRQVCILLLFAGLAACGGGDRDVLKAEIEQTLEEVSDELAALKVVKMEQQSALDGLKEDLKWEYSEELDKYVRQYESEFSMLKENIDELNGIYDAVAGYREKLDGAPLEYSRNLITEMFEENRKHFAEIVEENEAIQEKFYDLADELDELGAAETPETTDVPEESSASGTTDIPEESNIQQTTDSVE